MSKRGASSKLDRDNWEDEDPHEETGEFRKASPAEMEKRKIHKAKRRPAGTAGATNAPVFSNFVFGVKNNSTSAAPTFNFLGPPKDSSNSNVLKSDSSKTELEGVKSIFNFGGKTTDLSKSPVLNFRSNISKGEPKLNNGKVDEPPKAMFGFSAKSPPKPSFNLSEKKMDNASNLSSSETEARTLVELEKKSSTDAKFNPSQKSPLKEATHKNTKDYLAQLKALNNGLADWVKKHLDKNPYVNLTPVFEDYKNHFRELQKLKSGGTLASTKVKTSIQRPADSAISEKETSSLSSNSENPLTKPKSSIDSTMLISAVSTNSSTIPTFSFGNKTTPSSSGSVSDFFKSRKLNVGLPSAPSGDFSSSTNFSSKPFTFSSSDSSQPSIFGASNSLFNFSNGENKSNTTFNFGDSKVSAPTAETKTDEDNEEPQKEEIKEVKEADALYEKKVKLFYKKDGSWVDKGVGTLFLKEVDTKTQLIVRAFTNLGNILLNIVLNESIPTQKQGKNNVLIVCVPNPPTDPKAEDKNIPVPMLIKVKTAEDCDELLSKIETHKANH